MTIFTVLSAAGSLKSRSVPDLDGFARVESSYHWDLPFIHTLVQLSGLTHTMRERGVILKFGKTLFLVIISDILLLGAPARKE